MKVQNISLINKYNTIKTTNNFQSRLMPNLPFDSISFSSKQLDVKEVLDLIRESDKIQSRASEVQKDAQEYLEYSRTVFNDSYRMYLMAHKYIGVVKRNLNNPNLKLSNGDILRFKLNVEGSSLNLQMDIYGSDDNKKYTILTKGLNPTQIVKYGDNNRGNIYQYSNNEIIVSDNICLAGNNEGDCDANYVFINGQLASIRTNVNHKSIPQTSDEFYYFVDDKLSIAEIENKMNLLTGISENKARYTYVADKLFNYYENFRCRGRNKISFDESFHFVNGTFIAHTIDAKQVDNSGTIKADEAIYMKTGKYYQAENKSFHIKDAGIIKFEDN